MKTSALTIIFCVFLATGCGDQSSAEPTWERCEATSDCELVDVACCEPCGRDILASGYVAVNREQRDAYLQSDAYAALDGSCDTDLCPACEGLTLEQPTGHVRAVCAPEGRCEVYDVQSSPEASCEVSTDCVFRWGTCCPPPAISPDQNWDYVTLNSASEADYADRVCVGMERACPEYAYPDFSADFIPECSALKQCIAGQVTEAR